jgi:transposase-like protein
MKYSKHMIAKLLVYKCRSCESQNIVKNGHNASGSQQYLCKACGKRGVLEPKRGYTEAQKEQILSAYHERSSMRGVQRTFGVSRPTLAAWLKKGRSQSQT